MVEMAFKVNPGTTFYKNYFATKEEKAHFIEIAKQFFDNSSEFSSCITKTPDTTTQIKLSEYHAACEAYTEAKKAKTDAAATA